MTDKWQNCISWSWLVSLLQFLHNLSQLEVETGPSLYRICFTCAEPSPSLYILSFSLIQSSHKIISNSSSARFWQRILWAFTSCRVGWIFSVLRNQQLIVQAKTHAQQSCQIWSFPWGWYLQQWFTMSPGLITWIVPMGCDSKSCKPKHFKLTNGILSLVKRLVRLLSPNRPTAGFCGDLYNSYQDTRSYITWVCWRYNGLSYS